MIIGYFDYIVIGILIIINIKFWKKEINRKIGCIVGLIFGIVLPIISQGIEIQRVKMTIGIMDNYEILYTFFKFPIYWIIVMVQLNISCKSDWDNQL